MRAVLDRVRLLGAGLLLVTFAAGVLSGAALDRVLTTDRGDAVSQEGEREGEAEGEGEGESRSRSYVIDAIDMSDEQRGAINRILEDRTERMQTVWREVEPRLDAITDSARTEIMEVLTPEQRAAYEEKLAERRGRRDGRER